MITSSEQLTNDINAARTAEFGEGSGTEQFPSEYFRYDIVVTAPDGQTTPRSPRYCATNKGADEISEVIATELSRKNAIVQAPAMSLEGGWSDSATVPWLVFQMPGETEFKSPRVNAAILLDYYNHGYPPSRARNSCELEIYDAYVQVGVGVELTPAERQAVINKP